VFGLLSIGNEFNLQVNEISFSYARMGTKTRFENEAKGKSKMTYCNEGRSPFLLCNKNLTWMRDNVEQKLKKMARNCLTHVGLYQDVNNFVKQ